MPVIVCRSLYACHDMHCKQQHQEAALNAYPVYRQQCTSHWHTLLMGEVSIHGGTANIRPTQRSMNRRAKSQGQESVGMLPTRILINIMLTHKIAHAHSVHQSQSQCQHGNNRRNRQPGGITKCRNAGAWQCGSCNKAYLGHDSGPPDICHKSNKHR